MGQVDLRSLTLHTPQFIQIPRNFVDFMDYDRRNEYNNIEETSGMKILCDVDRICELEDEVNLWHVVPSEDAALNWASKIPVMKEAELRLLQAHFEIEMVWFNESDSFHHGKRLLRAVKETRHNGLILEKSLHDDKLLIVEVLPRGQRLEHEVRRRGIIDSQRLDDGFGPKGMRIQLCVGDQLMIYVSHKI